MSNFIRTVLSAEKMRNRPKSLKMGRFPVLKFYGMPLENPDVGSRLMRAVPCSMLVVDLPNLQLLNS